LGLPSLSDTVKRTCDVLKRGAESQVKDYERRFSSVKDLYEGLLANLTKTDYDLEDAFKTARDFFGTESVSFAGIDGTMYSRPLFDMVIFFGGAYASTGTVTFSREKRPQINYDAKAIQQGMGISSVMPIYINEIPDVDQTFFAPGQPNEVNNNMWLTDEAIINNATIANWIMTFSEYYLAYKLASDNTKNTQIILLDRSLSTERSSLLYDTGKPEFWMAKCSILGYKIDDTPIDLNDLTIARQYVCNQALGLPPPRADYLRFAIIDLVKRSTSATTEQILSTFKIEDDRRRKRLERALNGLVKRGVLNKKDAIYTLNPMYISSWVRAKKLTISIGEKLFFKRSEETETTSSIKVRRDGKEHWLTTLDFAFLTLFTLHMLLEECWNRHTLLIGITKDTAARDFKRQLIPIMLEENLLETQLQREELQQLPNTDRMILQSASIFSAEKIKPPWCLIEYDSAFRTMLPDRGKRKGYISGAIKNKIGLEKTFLKTYVQLSQAKSDPLLRSNVLLIDRLVHPEFDCQPESLTEFWNELIDGTKEPVETILFRNKTAPNRLQNLIMSFLVAMTPENIPEAFGHNKALFIADKVAKWNYSQFKCVVDTTAVWMLNNHKLRKFIFYMSTFRERRASIEQARRENR
jgi:hypothetical protein